MKSNQKAIGLKENTHAANPVAVIVGLVIVIMVAASLITTVALQSNNAAANADVVKVPGGVAMVNLWPLLFAIAPILLLLKEIFG